MSLFSRRRRYEELNESIREHLAERVDVLVSEAVPRAEAELQARKEFGNVTRIEEQGREVWQMPWLASIGTDVRLALRQTRKSPGFAAVVIGTLALGIGATTAIFTLVHAVLLKSLPVTKPEELWRFGDKVHCCGWGGYTQDEEFSLFNYELYRRFRDNTPAFTDLAAFQGGDEHLAVRPMSSSQPADTRYGQFISGNFFRTFGIGPWLGRVLSDGDDRDSAPPVAVMSYHAWATKYGKDPSMVGAAFQINSKPFTVIGVAAPGFFGANLAAASLPDFWIPLSEEPLLEGETSRLKTPDSNWLDIIGRVRPGTNPKTLEEQLKIELRQWQVSHLADMSPLQKESLAKQQFHLTPGGAGVTSMREYFKDSLELLLAAAGCVLLIACANLANLLLVRGLKNRQQTSVRLALGASRGRLVRKALIESVILGLMGGAAGLAVAFAGTILILRLAFRGPDSYVPIDAAPSLPVLLFALGLSLLTGVLFGVAPAWMTSHAQPVQALRGANRSAGQKAKWPQKALVIGQAAISLVLLSAAAMLAQSLRNLEHQNFGFEARDHYLASIDPRSAGFQPPQLDMLYKRILDRVGRIPGVKAVTAATYAPMSGDSWNEGIFVQGRPAPHEQDDFGATWTRVTPGFFAALNNGILNGRPVTDQDTANSPKVAVVNEAFAQRFFKGQNPIGKHFGIDDISHAGDFEIVGVAANMRYITYDLKSPARPMFFLPSSQQIVYATASDVAGEKWSHYFYNLVIWLPGRPDSPETQVRHALMEVDPNLALTSFAKYEDTIERDFGQQELIANLTMLFGALALVLAAVGLYGVTAYTVEQRTNEIGIRMALGADRSSVLGMILRSAFLQVLIGLVIGVPAAIATGRAITDQLYGVRPYDPAMLAIATFLLGIAAFLASVIPARRAASSDPIEALRIE
ncbi:MAG TPA: ABC transporter permease [Terracidiphilus sp.]|jgi:predicted permease